MRPPSRLASALLAGALAGLPGCKDVLVYEPATPAQVREAAAKPGSEQAVRFNVRDELTRPT